MTIILYTFHLNLILYILILDILYLYTLKFRIRLNKLVCNIILLLKKIYFNNKSKYAQSGIHFQIHYQPVVP